MEKYTAEFLFNGRLILFQPKKGYRYTIDPLILCNHIHTVSDSRILDIGCGCGIMPLILGFKYPDTRVTGIEIQDSLADIAKKNIIKNKMTPRIRILHKDIARLSPADTDGRFDQIISNPPYKKSNTGRLNPNLEKAIARHEIKLTIPTLFAKAEELLAPAGRITIILPADRLFDAHQAMLPTSIRPEWIRFIHTSPKKNAKRIIISAVKNTKSSCRVHPSLNLYNSRNTPTKEYQNIISP